VTIKLTDTQVISHFKMYTNLNTNKNEVHNKMKKTINEINMLLLLSSKTVTSHLRTFSWSWCRYLPLDMVLFLNYSATAVRQVKNYSEPLIWHTER